MRPTNPTSTAASPRSGMPGRRLRALGALAITVTLVVGAAACSSGGSDTATATGDTKAGSTSTTTAPIGATAAAPGKTATAKPVPSKGCGTSTTRAVLEENQVLEGSDRSWLLSTPKEHDGRTPLPLVLDFHGLMEGAQVHKLNSKLGPFAQSHGFIVAMPNGTGTPVHWEIARDTEANPDLVFVDQVIDQLESTLCVDTSRIYATGLSNGAFLSSTLACVWADRFAAVAPVAGLVWGTDCKPARPIPVLTFHGTEDPILLFNGGVGDRLNSILSGDKDAPLTPVPPADLEGKGYPQAVRDWAKANGCKDTFDDKDLSATVIERTYRCPASSPVVFDIVKGGGHTWPGTQFSKGLERIMGSTDESVDANDLIWAFFQRFALPAT